MEFRERLKRAMLVHNLLGHPLMALLILAGFTHLAAHVHEATVRPRTKWVGPNGIWLKTEKRTVTDATSWISEVSYGYTRVLGTGWLPFGIAWSWWWELNKDLGRVKEAA